MVASSDDSIENAKRRSEVTHAKQAGGAIFRCSAESVSQWQTSYIEVAASATENGIVEAVGRSDSDQT